MLIFVSHCTSKEPTKHKLEENLSKGKNQIKKNDTVHIQGQTKHKNESLNNPNKNQYKDQVLLSLNFPVIVLVQFCTHVQKSSDQTTLYMNSMF